jgi:cytochrome c peroxidase
MRFAFCLSCVVFLFSCERSFEFKDEKVVVRIPSGFPAINYPEDNEPTKLRIALGRRLFYDNRLSANHQVNCSSCHVLSAAFTDSKQPARVLPGLLVNEIRQHSPTSLGCPD